MPHKFDKWMELARNKPIPVLSHTIKELRHLCRQEDIPLKEITHLVERDPGIVVQVLHSSNNRKKTRLSSEITYIHQAFRLMGTDQLTQLPENKPSIEDTLEEPAKTRFLEALNRAYHAARFATDWAVLRRDMTPDEVFAATQLHFIGEMQLAIHAPELLAKVAETRKENHIPSEEAQFMVFGFTLNDFTSKLAEEWNLPPLVNEALHEENAKYPRAYGIMLGVQLSRSIFNEGWHSKHTMLLMESIAEWLDKPVDNVIARVHMIAAEVAREIPQYGVAPAIQLLPFIPEIPAHDISANEAIDNNDDDSEERTFVCLSPQVNVLTEAISELGEIAKKGYTASDIIRHTIDSMHDGIGLNRVVFCTLNKENNILEANEIKGAENDPLFGRFHVRLDEKNLFSHLVEKQQAVLINDANRQKYWPLVSVDFQKLINTNSFMAMSLFINDKLHGIFYADRHSPQCQIDEKSYQYFKSFCGNAQKLLARL